MANSTKYPRSYHLYFSPGTTSDDKKADNIDTILHKQKVITEKLDGSNSSLSRHGVFGRSHATVTHNPWDSILWDLHGLIRKDIDEDMYIFGENMYGIHSLEYRKLTSFFYVFGIRKGMEWLSWDDVKEYCYLLDLETVPVLGEGVFPDLEKTVTELVSQPSKLDAIDVHTGAIQMEGCVVRNRNAFYELDVADSHDRFNGNLLKWVRENHVATDEHWTKNWKKASLITY